jgi:hypothetical protein
MGAATPTDILLNSIVTGLVEGPIQSFAEQQASRAKESFDRSSLERHSTLLGLRAEQTREAGEAAALDELARARQLRGSQRAALAASGRSLTSQTARALVEESRAAGAEAAETVRTNAFRQALGLDLETDEVRRRAQFVRRSEKARRRTSLITGGLQFARRVQHGEAEAAKRR